MWSDRVVVVDIVVDAGNHLPGCCIFLNIDVVIFQTAEEPFSTDIVKGSPLAVHGDFYLVALQQIKICLTSEVATLIGVMPNSA